jgi:hypothetical protein
MTGLCTFFFLLLSSSFRSFVRVIHENFRLRSYEQEERYLYWIILLRKEMVSILVYILLAFFYKLFGLVDTDSPVTHMNFRRWLIKASFFPVLFVCIMLDVSMKLSTNISMIFS